MASIIDDGFRRRIQFVDSNGKKRTISLPAATAKQAKGICVRVEKLAAAVFYDHSPDEETMRWVGTIDDRLHAKLAAVGLVESRGLTGLSTLGAFLAELSKSWATLRPNTQRNYKQSREALERHFGKDRTLRSIGAQDADVFRAWLEQEGSVTHGTSKGYALPTASKYTVNARSFFKAAVRWKLILANPFAGTRCGSQKNSERAHFITREDTGKLLASCPDAEWKLILALSRFGGLRCPSETLALRLGDVDWEKDRFWVSSCKTKAHEGGEGRWVPIFPELRPFLMDAYTTAPEGAVYFIRRYRDPRQNLRTQLGRIIKRAGLVAWPRLFHNLRATRQTELVERYPTHVVCAWLGNSPAVAANHYLQVRDDHFTSAAKELTGAATARTVAELSHGLSLATAKPGVTEGNGGSENRVFALNSDECGPVTTGNRSRQESNL